MRKIYICGKVTGLPEEQVKEKFEAAQEMLEAVGYTVVNPIKLVNNPKAEWKSAMHTCLKGLIDCNEMYVLYDWQTSKGARLEILVAKALGIGMRLQDQRQANAFTNYVLTYTWQTETNYNKDAIA